MLNEPISYFLLPVGQYNLNSYKETAIKLNRGLTYVSGRMDSPHSKRNLVTWESKLYRIHLLTIKLEEAGHGT